MRSEDQYGPGLRSFVLRRSDDRSRIEYGYNNTIIGKSLSVCPTSLLIFTKLTTARDLEIEGLFGRGQFADRG